MEANDSPLKEVSKTKYYPPDKITRNNSKKNHFTSFFCEAVSVLLVVILLFGKKGSLTRLMIRFMKSFGMCIPPTALSFFFSPLTLTVQVLIVLFR